MPISREIANEHRIYRTWGHEPAHGPQFGSCADIACCVEPLPPEKCEALRAVGAKIATRPADVFKQAKMVIVMLFDSAVLDSVLARGTPDFAMMVAGHTIINTSSTSPAYSRGLEADIRDAGGRYVDESASSVPSSTASMLDFEGLMLNWSPSARGWK